MTYVPGCDAGLLMVQYVPAVFAAMGGTAKYRVDGIKSGSGDWVDGDGADVMFPSGGFELTKEEEDSLVADFKKETLRGDYKMNDDTEMYLCQSCVEGERMREKALITFSF